MKVVPHLGVGRIRFGMTRMEVAATVGQVPRRGRRNQFAVSDYDFFEQMLMFVYYDAQDTAQAVEFGLGSDVVYDGYELFAHPAPEVLAWARQRDESLDEEDGFRSDALGLSMYAPGIDHEPDEPAQGFMIFRFGYHEEEHKRLPSA